MTLPIGNHFGRLLGYADGIEVLGVVCCEGTTGLPVANNAGRLLGYADGIEVLGASCCLPDAVLPGAKLIGRLLGYADGIEVIGVAEPCCTSEGGSGSGSGSGVLPAPPTCRLICRSLWTTHLPAMVMGNPYSISPTDTTIIVDDASGFPAAPFFAVLDDGGTQYEIVGVTGVAVNTLTVQRGCNQVDTCTGNGYTWLGGQAIRWDTDPPDTLLATVETNCDSVGYSVPVTLTRYTSPCSGFDSAEQPEAICGWGGAFTDHKSSHWTICLFSYLAGSGSLSWEIVLYKDGVLFFYTVYGLIPGTFAFVTITENDCVPLDLDAAYPFTFDNCRIDSISIVE